MNAALGANFFEEIESMAGASGGAPDATLACCGLYARFVTEQLGSPFLLDWSPSSPFDARLAVVPREL